MSPQVIVLGAGPAGCSVAARLARAGVSVLVLSGSTRAGWEGLSERSVALLAADGVDVRQAGLAGPLPRGGSWVADREVAGAEWLCERSQLARAFQGAAIEAGASLRFETVAGIDELATGWRVRTVGDRVLAAAQIVDARGRRGPARRGPLLLAYGQEFLGVAGVADGTRIHALARHWCWWAVHQGRCWVHVVGDPRDGDCETWLRQAAAQVPDLARALSGAHPAGPVRARSAHARLALPADTRVWRVGDAALALDPLSGQGVYEALRSAALLATAVGSVLNGGDEGLARRFVRERTTQAWERGVRTAAAFYEELANRGEFWRRTAGAYAAVVGNREPVAPGVQRRPVLDRDRIVEREVVVTAEHPRGAWQVAGVSLAALKRYFESSAGATVADAARVLGHPAANVAAAVNWLERAGMRAPGLC